jgi:hypothetical protein
MDAVLRQFWLLAIGGTFLNAAIWWWNGRGRRRRDPSLVAGYRRLTLGFALWGSVPWLVMGMGAVIGGLPSVAYFDPANGPWVLAWYASILAIYALLGHWIFLRGGAEEVARHPGLLEWGLGWTFEASPWTVKGLVGLGIASGVGAMVMMFVRAPGPR